MKVILACRHFEREWKGFGIHAHSREYQIDYFPVGSGRYWIGDKWEGISNGDLFFIPPHIKHAAECNSDVPLDNLSIKFVTKKAERLDYFSSAFKVNIFSRYKKSIITKAKNIAGYYIMDRSIPEHYLRDILVILGKIVSENRVKLTTEEKIQKLIGIINQNYPLPLTLSWLAEKVQLNPYYLCREFKKIAGESVFKYINKTRMKNSLILLKSTDIPIKQIADKCGFKNVYYFSSNFKDCFSVPPGKMRKHWENASLSVHKPKVVRLCDRRLQRTRQSSQTKDSSGTGREIGKDIAMEQERGETANLPNLSIHL